MSPAAAPRRFWENAAARLASRVNFAAWLDSFAPGAFAAGSAAAVALYALRRARGPESWGVAALALALAVAALVAWPRARRRFFSRADARVLLEYQLGLDATLSAASAGVAAWPPPAPLPQVLRWRAPDTLGWLAGGLALVAASLWLPVPAATELAARPVELPPALAETETMLREAAKLTAVDPVSVEPFTERAKELANKSPAEQYTHSGLEAADTLRAQTADALQNLARNFDNAAGALAPLADPKASLSDAQLGALAGNLASALRGMREGGLSANPDLLKQLSAAASASGLGQLTPQQAAQLAQQLGAAGAGARGVLGAAGAGASIAGQGNGSGRGNGNGQGWGKGNGSGNGPGQSGSHGLGPNNGFGSGGPGGGGGTGPLTFGDKPSDAGNGTTQGVSATDLAHAALGDLLDTQRGAHDVDPSKAVGPVSAGAVAAPANGGDAVWVDRLTPAERAVLKNFFK